MSKRSSKLKRVSDSIEEVFIELLSTVVRDHKGNVVLEVVLTLIVICPDIMARECSLILM